MKILLPSLVLAWVFPLFGCQAPPVELDVRTEWVSDLAREHALPGALQEDLAPVTKTMRSQGGLLETGDRIAFEIQIRKEGATVLRYLILRVVGPSLLDGERQYQDFEWTHNETNYSSSTPVHRIQLDLYDVAGAWLESSDVPLAEGIVQDHVAACVGLEVLTKAIAAEARESQVPGEVLIGARVPGEVFSRTMAASVHSLVAFFGLLQEDRLLSEMLWDVVDRPSAFSVVMAMGVELGLNPGYFQSTQLEESPPGIFIEGPFRNLPVAITVNGRVVLQLSLLVTKPAPPWGLTGGILAFEAHHPVKDVSIRAQMVAGGCAPAWE